MIITTEDLVQKMTTRGLYITSRRVTDWVQRDLLPRRKQRGRGRGRGTIYYWEHPEVVDQAIAVSLLLEMYGRVRRIYLPLLCLGHEVPLPWVRWALTEWLDSLAIDGYQDVESAEELRSWLGMMARLEWEPGDPEEAERTAAIFNLLLSPSATLLPKEIEVLGEISGSDPSLWLPWYHQHASYSEMCASLRAATDDLLLQVIRDWQLLLGWLHPVAAVFGLRDERLWPGWVRLTSSCVPCLLLVDLSVRRSGHGQLVDDLTEGVADLCQHALAHAAPLTRFAQEHLDPKIRRIAEGVAPLRESQMGRRLPQESRCAAATAATHRRNQPYRGSNQFDRRGDATGSC